MDFVDSINFYFYDKESNLLYDEKKYKFSWLRLVKNALEVLFKGVYSFFSVFLSKENLFDQASVIKDILFVSVSTNNTRALEPIFLRFKNRNNASLINVSDLNLRGMWFFSLRYLPSILNKCLKSSGYDKETYCYNLVTYCKSFGLYHFAKRSFEESQIKALVFADHQTYTTRALYKAAQHSGVKTFYVQHASAVDFDPPLDMDYACLDGEEALNTYSKRNDISSTVFITGNPRLDQIAFGMTNNWQVNQIGLAVNMLDSFELVKPFIEKLQKNIQAKIIVRPHPAINQEIWMDFAKVNGLGFSDPKKENVSEFIKSCRGFISGDSSFHLDVCIAAKVSLYANFNKYEYYDIYNFIKNGLVQDVTNIEHDEINTLLYNSFDFDKLKFYAGNFGENHWLNSSNYIMNVIKENVKYDSVKD